MDVFSVIFPKADDFSFALSLSVDCTSGGLLLVLEQLGL